MYKYLRERLLAQSLSLLPPFFLTVSRVPYSSQVPPGGAKNHALVYNEPSGLKAAPYIDSLMVQIFINAEDYVFAVVNSINIVK